MSLWSECCVLSGRGLWDGLIIRPEESDRLWCVVECDLETSRMGRSWPTGGLLRPTIYIYIPSPRNWRSNKIVIVSFIAFSEAINSYFLYVTLVRYDRKFSHSFHICTRWLTKYSSHMIVRSVYASEPDLTCTVPVINTSLQPPRHSFFLVSLCLKANAEMVPKIPSCHYMLLM